MDGNRFDSLTRTFSTSRSRRGVLKGLGAATLGAVGLGRLSMDEADAAPCKSPHAKCGKGKDKVCVDLSSDPGNCGGCGQSCPEGASCVDGGCVEACSEGFDLCNGNCVDLSNDATNCGGCGTTCPETGDCVSGVCTCPTGQVLCAGGCVSTSNDHANCGGCGNVCLGGETCIDGACEAGTPLVCEASAECQSACPGTSNPSCYCGTTYDGGDSVCYLSPGCPGNFCNDEFPCEEPGATCVFGFCTRPSLYCETIADCDEGFACVNVNSGCGGCDNYTGGLGTCSQICTG